MAVKTRATARAKALPPNSPPASPEKSPSWAPYEGETGLPGPSAGRRAAADVFRAFSRNETPADVMPAVRWLTRLRGFGKDEADCWIFICERIFGHAELFAESDDDRQVLSRVEKMFKAYMKVQQRKEARRRKLFPVISIDDENEKALLIDWTKLKAPSKAELALAAEVRSIKKAADYLKRLKRFPELLEQMYAALRK